MKIATWLSNTVVPKFQAKIISESKEKVIKDDDDPFTGAANTGGPGGHGPPIFC